MAKDDDKSKVDDAQGKSQQDEAQELLKKMAEKSESEDCPFC